MSVAISPYIQCKNTLVSKVISLIKIIKDSNINDVSNIKINMYNKNTNEHNFYIKNRIFEIQYKDSKWNILAESKNNSGQQFKVGKIPSKFLNIKELHIVVEHLTALIENRETIHSLEDIYE